MLDTSHLFQRLRFKPTLKETTLPRVTTNKFAVADLTNSADAGTEVDSAPTLRRLINVVTRSKSKRPHKPPKTTMINAKTAVAVTANPEKTAPKKKAATALKPPKSPEMINLAIATMKPKTTKTINNVVAAPDLKTKTHPLVIKNNVCRNLVRTIASVSNAHLVRTATVIIKSLDHLVNSGKTMILTKALPTQEAVKNVPNAAAEATTAAAKEAIAEAANATTIDPLVTTTANKNPVVNVAATNAKLVVAKTTHKNKASPTTAASLRSEPHDTLLFDSVGLL